MLWPERLLVDRQGAPEEWFGLGVTALDLVQAGAARYIVAPPAPMAGNFFDDAQSS